MTTLKADQWLTESLRITVFPCRLEDIGSELDWEKLLGESPESIEDQPRNKFKISRGPFGKGQLVHARYPDRIELIYVSSIGPSPMEAFPNLGPMASSLDTFSPIALTWIEGLPPIKRIAFGPTLIRPVESHKEAYEYLGSLLHHVSVDAASSDFSYQINRPRRSKVKPDLKINRLSRWNAIKLRGLRVVGVEVALTIPLQEKYAARVEMDINTDQDLTDELPSRELPALFNELVELSREILKAGDVS